MAEGSNIETRPLAFFLKRRIEDQEQEQVLARRQQRLEKRKTEEDIRKKTALERKTRSVYPHIRNDLSRVDSFIAHSVKSLSSAKKTFEGLPSEFLTNKELGLLSDTLRKLESFQKILIKKSAQVQEQEDKDRLEAKKLAKNEKPKEKI